MTSTPEEKITREELVLILADVKAMWASLRDIAMTAPGAAATISTRMELPEVIDMVFEQAGLTERGECPNCKGSGETQAMTQHLGPDDYTVTVECPECKGTGSLPSETRLRAPRAWMNAEGLISTVPGGGYVTPLYAAPQPVTSPDEISRVPSEPAVAAPDTRTPKGHRQRHVELHKAFDELFADYMRHHSDQHEFLGMPLKTLLQWSYEQTIKATE